MEEEKTVIHKRMRDNTILVWLFLICLVATLARYISDNYFQLAVINGNSMVPAYRHMQITVIDKHSKDYKAGDVIVFKCQGLSETLVKRIAGVPGNILKIKDGKLYIDGIERYEDKQFNYAGILDNEIKLGEDEYIVFGDNISESKDSRYEKVGIVKGCDIIGEVR